MNNVSMFVFCVTFIAIAIAGWLIAALLFLKKSKRVIKQNNVNYGNIYNSELKADDIPKAEYINLPPYVQFLDYNGNPIDEAEYEQIIARGTFIDNIGIHDGDFLFCKEFNQDNVVENNYPFLGVIRRRNAKQDSCGLWIKRVWGVCRLSDVTIKATDVLTSDKFKNFISKYSWRKDNYTNEDNLVNLRSVEVPKYKEEHDLKTPGLFNDYNDPKVVLFTTVNLYDSNLNYLHICPVEDLKYKIHYSFTIKS